MQKSTLDQSLGSYLGWFGLFAIRAIVGYRAAAGIVKLRSADGSFHQPGSRHSRYRARRMASDTSGLRIDGRYLVRRSHSVHAQRVHAASGAGGLLRIYAAANMRGTTTR
jgi:hypothetical protein